MTLFSAILTPSRQLMALLRSDNNFREQLVYKEYTGETFDEGSGHTVNTYNSHTLYGVRMYHNQESVRAATSEVEIGDMLFMFLHEEFPEEYSLKDVIVDGEGNILGVKGIDPVFTVAVVVTVSGAK
jgi:hypothetical protein